MTDEPAIVQAARHHWAELGQVLGQVFAHDPVASWTLGGPPSIGAVFGRLAREVYLPRGTCHFAAGPGAKLGARLGARPAAFLGGSMWLAAGQSKDMGLFSTLAAGWPLLRLGGVRHPWRALAVDVGMRRRRPTALHMYLFAVGVAEAARGRGIGRRLLAPVLAECDRAGLPAYLENSRDRNTGFYQSLGFRQSADAFRPVPGCPPLQPMWREPRR